MNRRQFLLGSAAGLVLPSFFDKVLSYVENHGEPLLVAPRNVAGQLYACTEFTDGESWELNLGDPSQEPPAMTIQEFAKHYGPRDWKAWYREGWNVADDEPVDWHAPMDDNWVIEAWCQVDSPFAKAHRYLKKLDLGPQLKGARAVGELQFVYGGAPGMDYLAVHAADQVTLSLLQNRLNELGTGLQIVLS